MLEKIEVQVLQDAYRNLKEQFPELATELLKIADNHTHSPSGLSVEEAEVIKEAVSNSEFTLPGMAMNLSIVTYKYGLFTEWFGQKIEDIRAYLEQKSGYVLTARDDGTTQRLNSIIIGKVLASKLGWKFKFSWCENADDWKKYAHMELDSHLPEYFSSEFVEENFIPYEEMKTFRLSSFRSCANEYVSGYQYWHHHLFNENELQQTKQMHLNIIAPNNISGEMRKLIGSEFRSVIDSLFCEKYLKEFERLSALIDSKKTIAIHYRASECIYGHGRNTYLGTWQTSLSLALIEVLVEQFPDHNIIVFTFPKGQSMDDVQSLKEKYDNVSIGAEISDPSFNHVVMDAYLMSCCDTLFAAGQSGVSYMATLFNNDLKTPLLTHESHYKVLSKIYHSPKYEGYNKLQRSFVNIQLFLFGKKTSVPEEQLNIYLQNVRILDPENRMEWIKMEMTTENAPGVN